ncbi:MAG: histidine phosphatase family protein [Kocuria sp.]|uniref:Histidine phosphatase family protein n=1 Tax=Kocuria salsicia TaxID=664639 RepID=A0ABV3KDJ6_9MICC|nr:MULTISPECIES: histidine phosphatase family protein [Kocuria]MBS6031382.1 histidine phosphatase family protein [Kocuria rhizophila]WNB88082.1 histidine phosphatase family protein [Glutamicibacter protophormiae]MDO4257355.1 histidine phosphatase family protein [Kocuria sp.]RUP83947.1 histidine phosphatase family protein [Kocuria sp. HSID17590]RUQ05795.1 histidine phosphatase family protein [Kocuria sp. HSID17582]
MTETTLTLIRHGQTDWNLQGRLQGRSDIPLNETGREQAREVGRELAASGRHWDVLVSSPLARARETAQLIGEQLGLTLSGTYEDLVERAFGDAEGYDCTGMSDDERHAFMEHHGETAEDVIRRGIAVLQQIIRDHPGKNVMVVAHGTIIRLTVDRIRGTQLHSLANGEVLDVTSAEVAAASAEESRG